MGYAEFKEAPKLAAHEGPRVITIMLDKPRNLVYDMNAAADFEELTGNDLLRDATFRPHSVVDIRAFLWCCAKQEDETLTLEQVGAYLFAGHLKEAMHICLRLLMHLDTNPDAMAPYVPTPHEVFTKALELSGLKEGERFFDLGCGDGRVLAAALAHKPKRVVGVEFDEKRHKMASQLLEMSGAPAGSKVVHGKIQDLDFTRADVVYVYLLPESNEILDPKLRALPKTSRVVTHDFPMEGWVAGITEKVEVEGNEKGTTVEHIVYVYRLEEQEWYKGATTDAAENHQRETAVNTGAELP